MILGSHDRRLSHSMADPESDLIDVLNRSGSGGDGRFKEFVPQSGPSEILKGFGRREAYESLGRTNPRHRESVMGNLQLVRA